VQNLSLNSTASQAQILGSSSLSGVTKPMTASTGLKKRAKSPGQQQQSNAKKLQAKTVYMLMNNTGVF
jgi:hypothetical protein